MGDGDAEIFSLNKKDRSGGQICLHGEDEKHIKTVLRAKEGEELTLCDGEGMDYQCRISSLADGVQLEVLSQAPAKQSRKQKLRSIRDCRRRIRWS